MLSAERKQYILRSLNKNGIIHVKTIASELSISETTIRRDLIEMEKLSLCKRVHGGAMKKLSSIIHSDETELSMIQKSVLHNDEKDRIAKEAANLVKDGDCVFLDGGTSIAPIIKHIVHKRIKIVTHSDLIIRQIENTVAEVIVIGGKYIPKYAMTVGPIAYKTMQQFNFDLSFIGCAGVSVEDGISWNVNTLVDTFYIV